MREEAPQNPAARTRHSSSSRTSDGRYVFEAEEEHHYRARKDPSDGNSIMSGRVSSSQHHQHQQHYKTITVKGSSSTDTTNMMNNAVADADTNRRDPDGEGGRNSISYVKRASKFVAAIQAGEDDEGLSSRRSNSARDNAPTPAFNKKMQNVDFIKHHKPRSVASSAHNNILASGSRSSSSRRAPKEPPMGFEGRDDLDDRGRGHITNDNDSDYDYDDSYGLEKYGGTTVSSKIQSIRNQRNLIATTTGTEQRFHGSANTSVSSGILIADEEIKIVEVVKEAVTMKSKAKKTGSSSILPNGNNYGMEPPSSKNMNKTRRIGIDPTIESPLEPAAPSAAEIKSKGVDPGSKEASATTRSTARSSKSANAAEMKSKGVDPSSEEAPATARSAARSSKLAKKNVAEDPSVARTRTDSSNKSNMEPAVTDPSVTRSKADSSRKADAKEVITEEETSVAKSIIPPSGRLSSWSWLQSGLDEVKATSNTSKELLPPQMMDDVRHQRSTSSVGSTSTAGCIFKGLVQPMRWTEQETDNLLMQLEFLADTDKEFLRFAKPGAVDTQTVVECIHSIVEKNKKIRRDDPMLLTLSKSLHSIQLVDLDRLLELLQEQRKAGDMMEGKRVLLLCGPSGSGKTTTLHFLAGTTLEEVEEQGFFHLKPVHYKNKHLKDYETSCYKKRTTRSMQATSVTVGNKGKSDKEIIVCDTPGLGPFESVEEEISNGLGMASELQRAKTVHPLIILSKETLGSRFGYMKDIIHAMRDQFVLESKNDLEPLNYLFSKYGGKDRGRICKQISVMENVPIDVPEEDQTMFKAVVKDIMKKTTPKANLVLPMEDSHVQYLQDLWETVEERDGKNLLAPFASVEATQQFKMQLQLTLYDFANLLAKGDYKLAIHRLRQLQELAHILPEARVCAEKAEQVGTRHISLVSELAREMIEAQDFTSAVFRISELEQLDKEIPGARSSRERTLKKLRKTLKHMAETEPIEVCLDRLTSLGKLRKQQPQLKEFIQQGFGAILKVILRSIEEQDFDTTLHHLDALSKITHKLPEAGECAWRAMQAMKELVQGLTKGSDFGNLLQFMVHLSKVADVFPDATECIQIGFESLKEKSMTLFESKNYNRFIAQIRQLSELTPFLPYDHVSVNRKDMLLMDTIGEIVDKQDFNTAVDVVQSLQNLDAIMADATECIEGGFESLMQRAVSTINEVHYRQTAGMMQKLSKLLPALPAGTDSIERGLKLLVCNVQRIVLVLDIKEAIDFLGQLHKESKDLPQIQESIDGGFTVLFNRSTKIIGTDSHWEGLEQMILLAKAVRTLSISGEAVQRGIDGLPEAVKNAVDIVDLEAGVELIHRLNKFRDLHAGFVISINGGFEKLMQKAAKPMSVNDFPLALSQLEALGNIKHKFVLADNSVDRSIKEVSITLKKFLQFMEFQKAIDVLQKFFKLSRTFPETSQCVHLGFEILLEKSVDLFDHNECSESLAELKLLGQIFQQFSLPEEITRGNLKCLATLIPKAVLDIPFEEASLMLQELTDIRRLMPQATECVHVAYEILLKALVAAISKDHYSTSFAQMHQLASIVEGVPYITESSRRGLQQLELTVSETTDTTEFDDAIKLIKKLNELSNEYPKVKEVVQLGFGGFLERTARAFEKEGFAQGIHHLQKMGPLSQLLEMEETAAIKESRHRVLQHLVGTVQKNIEILVPDAALKFLQDLNDVSKTYPEAREGVQAGFEALLQRAINNLEQKRSPDGLEQLVQVAHLQSRLNIDQSGLTGLRNIEPVIMRVLETSKVIELSLLMEKVGDLAINFPELLSCINRGLYLLWDNFELSMTEYRYDAAAGLLKDIGAYQMTSPAADRIWRKGMKRMKKAASNTSDNDQATKIDKLVTEVMCALAEKDGSYQKCSENLRVEMEIKIQEQDYRAAAILMHTLVTEMAERVPAAEDYARDGFRLVVKEIDNSATNQDSSNIVAILQQFSKLDDFLPEASLCLEYGSSVLKSLVEKSVAKQEFGDTAILIETLHASSSELKRLQGVIQHGVSLLGKAMEKPLHPGKHDEIVHVIQQFSHSLVPKASDCARRGLKGLWTSVKRSIEEQDYTVAIGLMRQMKELAQDLPEAGDCVQLAFVALRVRLIKTIDKQNYASTMGLLQQLCSLGDNLPEAMDCAQFGFEALQERLGKTIEEQKYAMVVQQLKHLDIIEESIPEVADLFKLGFDAISNAVSVHIGKAAFKKAVDLMELLTDLAKERADAMDCTRKGLFSFWSAFEKLIDQNEYRKSVEVLLHLGKLSCVLSEAEDGVQLGFEVLEEKFENMIEMKDYDSAVAIMQDLSKLAYELPEASSCIQNGFEVLRERLVKIIELQDYSTARNLIGKLEGKLEQQLSHPALHKRTTRKISEQTSKESEESVTEDSLDITVEGEEKVDVSVSITEDSLENTVECEQKVNVSVTNDSLDNTIECEGKVYELRERLLSTIEDNNFGAAVDVMVTLSNMEHVVPAAGKTLELGYTKLRKQLSKLMEKMDCKTMLDAIVTLESETHRLPAVGECTQYGLDEVHKIVERQLEQKEYTLAAELMNLLCNISHVIVDAFDYTQGALTSAIQHMANLREETAVSFEELGGVHDNKLFAEMLITSCENLEAVVDTEELRTFCTQLDKKVLGPEDGSKTLECTMRLATSQTFCKEQVRRVVDAVRGDFPDLMVETAFIDIFAGAGDRNLLAVLERLTLLKKVLNKCPGAKYVISAQSEAFEMFSCFLDGVISLAQTEFIPNMNLRAFQTQVLLVTFLVDGFLESNGTISDDEQRKMEDLEHRQARLMLRFEIEVADALEVICKNSFPTFTKDDPREKLASYIRTMRVSQLQKHREVLLACVNSRQLAVMISDNVDISSADRLISSFDKSLENFLEHMILRLEDDVEAIDASPKTKGGAPTAAKEQLEVLCKDIPKLVDEVTQISSWATEVYSVNASNYLSRLKVLENKIEAMTKKIEEMDGIGFGAFLSTYVPNVSALASFKGMDYYSCNMKTTASGEDTI